VPGPQIFVSHASADEIYAGELASLLELRGFQPWLAKSGIPLGSNFAEEITKAIKESDYFIVLLSKNSIASPHVKREVSIAVDKGIALLPVIIGGSNEFIDTMPEEWIYWLTVVQVVQFENSTQTANEIVNHINSGKLSGVGMKRRVNSTIPKKWIAAALICLTVVGAYGVSQISNRNSASSPTANQSPQPIATVTAKESPKADRLTNTVSKNAILDKLVARLDKSGPLKWSIVEKIEFPIGEIGKIRSDDYKCEISIFPDLRSANFASDDRNYTTNAYDGWLDKDAFTSNYMILIAVAGDEICGIAASKALGWPVKIYQGPTFLEPGATPFDKCLISQVREYGGTKKEAIGPCKFQFERDGKAIPEQYLNLG